MVGVTKCMLVTSNVDNGNTVDVTWLGDMSALTVVVCLGVGEGRLLSWEAVNTWPEIIVGFIPISEDEKLLKELVIAKSRSLDILGLTTVEIDSSAETVVVNIGL